MTRSWRGLSGACVALLWLAAGPTSAATKDQQNCINTNNKNLQKVTSAIAKDIDACIKDHAKGALGTMTPTQCFVADRKGKVSKAKNKTVSGFNGRCVGNDKDGNPKLPPFGVSDPNTIIAAAEDKESALIEVLFGSDVAGVLIPEAVDKDASKCQQKVAKTYKKCQDTQLKEFNRCKKNALKAGANSALELESCMLADAGGKIAKACDQSGASVDKIRKDIDKKCVSKGVDLATAFPGCDETDPELLHACMITKLRCETCRAINTADGLARDCDVLDDGVSNGSCLSGTPNAAARLISDPNDLIGGLLARGRVGDYLLENDRIRVIVQKPGRNFSGAVGQFGGNIIDADLQRGGAPGNDLWEEFSLQMNLENTANYTSVVVLNDGSDGSPAILRATGPDDLLDRINANTVVEDFGFPFPAELDDTDQPVEITTDYILGRGDDFVRIDTTVTNLDTDPNGIDLFLGDFVSSLAQEIFHPGYGIGEPLVTTSASCDPSVPCDFIAYSQESGEKGGVSYAYIFGVDGTTSFNTTGVQVAIFGTDAVLALIGLAGPNFNVPPGGTVTVTRYLAVGDGDVGAVLDARNRIKGIDVGTVQGQVTVGGVGVPDAEIAVIGPPGTSPGTVDNVVSHFRTDADGNYSGTLPVSDYTLRVNKDGHLLGSPDPAAITVTSGGTVTQNFTLDPPATLEVSISDPNGAPIAGKISVVGFDPSPDPGNTQLVFGLISNLTGLFGDITKDGLPHGLARVRFVDHTGSDSFPLEPGDYRIVVSHGTEYSVFTTDLTATSGGTHVIAADVAPVVDTTGFISGDFHVHSFDSPDCAITRRERIISMLAEGVDFFTPSEHEFVADFEPDVAALGVSHLISTAPGNEISPFDYGHYGAIPRTVDPNQVNGGAIDWGGEAPPGMDFPSLGAFDLTPGEIFSAVKADPAVQMVMIHHVHSFFDGNLAVDTGVAPPQSFGDGARVRLDPNVPNYWDDNFEGLELWIETSRGQIEGNFLGQSAGNWFNLLNQGRVRSGISDSDTHQLVTNQAGFPRNFVASPTDDASAIRTIAGTIAANISDGKLSGTNGPFLRLAVEGDPSELGGLGDDESTLVLATGGSATFTLSVQSPDWAEFDTVEYYVNSATIADPNDRAGLPPLYRICPDFVQTAGVDFTVSSVGVNGKTRLEATSTLSLSGLTEDTWVVAMVKGSDGVSCPLFPVISSDLNPATNTTIGELRTCDLGVEEVGINSLAYTNPIFLDVNGNGVYDPPGLSFRTSCP